MIKKSILLGSAAAFAAVPMAQAADLPVAEPVDYVRICDAFGTGYHYIPGTETCLKFNGYVRAEIGIQDDNDDNTNDTTFLNSKYELSVTASSTTELGMLVGKFTISASNEGTTSVGDAWITIGENFLVGRETSRFDFGGGYGMYDCIYCDEALNQFSVIVPFGDGMSFTFGLEDARDRRTALRLSNAVTASISTIFTVVGTATINSTTTTVTAANSSTGYGGMEIPDIVASLRVSQGWGSAQVSAAAHHLRFANDEDSWGFAVQAGVELNAGSATTVKVVGGYADGALHYVGGGAVSFTRPIDSLGNTVTAGIAEAGYNAATDDIDTYDGWYVLGGINHDLNDQLTVGVTAAYHSFNDIGFADLTTVAESSYDFETWFVGATATYEPVDNLLLRLGGQYVESDIDDANNTLSLADDDDWQVKFRVQRSF